MFKKFFLVTLLALFLQVGFTNVAQAYQPPDKWIYLKLSTQTVTAYEGYNQVGQWPVMTGKDSTPTPIGWYYVWCKTECQTMQGKGYFLENVHYCTYFNGNIGFHEAWWRDPTTLGTQLYRWQGSHGCPGMTLDGARSIYNFAYKNMLVWVDN